MSIRTNLSSLVAQQSRLRAESALGSSIERLASGTRINSARDVVVVNTAQKSISSWTYLDDSGNTLSLSQPRLVRSAGKYWIEHQYNGDLLF